MRLVIVCADFPPIQSGEAGHALHLARALAKRGIEVHVLTSAIAGVQGDPSFAVHPIMSGWSWSFFPRLAGFLRRTAPDCVLLLYLDAMYRSHSMVTFLPSIARALVPGARFVTQFEHAGSTPHEPGFKHRLIRKAVAMLLRERSVNYELGTLLRDSDHIIALNEPHRLGLVEQWPPAASRISLIPPPPLMRIVPGGGGDARTRGRALLGVRPDEFVMLYYGYMYPGKGMETLIHAVHTAAKAQPSVRLVIAGEILEHVFSDRDARRSTTYKSELHELVRRLGISDRVMWTGACAADGEEGSLYMWAADVCVLPFDRGIQLNNSTFAAAASHGLAILTTGGAMLETPFVHGENVWLCPPRDADAMAAAMVTLITSPAERHRIGAGARALADELFSWDRAVDRTLALFDARAGAANGKKSGPR